MKRYLFCLFILLTCHRGVFAQLSSNALYFDGQNDEVIIDDDSAYNIGMGDFTVEAIIRDEATPGLISEETIFCNYFLSQSGFRFFVKNGQLTLIIGSSFGGILTSLSPFELRDGQCHHVAVKRQSGGIYFYLDGVEYNSGTGSFDPVANHAMYIGAYDNSQTFFSSFKGLIKEVRFWKIARTASEIHNNMMVVLNNSNTNLIGYWRCDGSGGGGSVIDYSYVNNPGWFGLLGAGSIPVLTTGCTSCVPLSSISVGGPLTFCAEGSVGLSANPGANYSYQWLKNGSPVGGSVAVSYTENASGTYAVNVTNNCGTSVSPPVIVTVNANPSPSIVASGPVTFCSGNNVLLSTTNTAGATFQWKKSGVVIPGATSSSYTATATGNYKVVKTNAAGCTGTSPVAAVVTVYGLPTASITPQGPTTFCAGDSVQLKTPASSIYSYIWKRNNVNISGASLAKYYAKSQGYYKVKVTNTNGCTKISNAISVTVPCRENELASGTDEFTYDVYPNPSQGFICVKLNNLNQQKVTISIFDLPGKMLINKTLQDREIKLDCSNLQNGIYILNVTFFNSMNLTKKIIIQK